jgi:glycerol kinase
MQFQADLLGIPVVRAKNIETTALGSAYLAGFAVGYYRSIDEIASQWAPDRSFEPSMSTDQREALRARWNKALARSKSWIDA